MSPSRQRAPVLAAALLASLVSLAAREAGAEPYLAVREGLHCSACHTNRTGGGKRTAFGVLFSQTVMPVYKFKAKDRGPEQGTAAPAERGFLVDPRFFDHFSVGAEVRVQNLTVLPATTTWQEKTLTAPAANTFRVPVANLFAEATFFRDHLVLYFDETVGPEGASARELFAMYRDLPLAAYVKAGRFLLPFGLRFPDDAIFVRDLTGFNYANQDLGVELGFEPGPAFAHVSVTNGTQGGVDNNNVKQVTATAGVRVHPFRVALSYAWADGSTNQSSVVRHVGGGYVGLGLGRLVLMAEGAVTRDFGGPGPSAPPGALPGRVRWQLATYAEADLLVHRGVNLRFAFDYLDPNLEIGNDHRVRYTAGIEVTPIPFLSIGAFYYVRRAIPQLVADNQDQLLLQIHGYL